MKLNTMPEKETCICMSVFKQGLLERRLEKASLDLFLYRMDGVDGGSSSSRYDSGGSGGRARRHFLF